MSSTFQQVPNYDIKGFGGQKYKVPFYLQFVPGHVVDVVHSDQSLKYAGDSTINTIIAIPHITDKTFIRRATAMSGENRRYYPLFRTMHDVPSKGDPVLLCTIGQVKYYLGPLNMPTNSPTWNDDANLQQELSLGDEDEASITTAGKKNISPNFNKEKHWKRLHKRYRAAVAGGLGFDKNNALYETTGDTLIEGRHGNSIRIGSRDDNPYIFISNGRSPQVSTEGLGDGSLISITRRGRLNLHFGAMPIQAKDMEKLEVSPFGFLLASDTVPVERMKRPMARLVSNINRDEYVGNSIYGWQGNQMLFNSDRITINSKYDDIYLSSIQDVHIGAGRHLTISTHEDVIIESEHVYLGSPIITAFNDKYRYFESLKSDDASERMQPMVLGQELYKILDELLEITRGLVTGNMWFPVKIHYQTERGEKHTPVNEMIEPLVQRLEKIVSNKHYIEPNDIEE